MKTPTAFDEKLSDRIREALMNVPEVTEKRMFGGICFMVDNKMCICASSNEMMCRVGEEHYEDALSKPGCREMAFTGRTMKGYVYVNEEGRKTNSDFQYWIDLCLAFNPKAKASKKRSKTRS